jgi:hypothetical protein
VRLTSDRLRLRHTPGTSLWFERNHQLESLDQARRQY